MWFFGSTPDERCWNESKNLWPGNFANVLILGEKNFGVNVNAVMVSEIKNFVFVMIRESVLARNTRVETVFKDNFIYMNALIGVSKSEVPILDSSGFLISQDGTHLTPKGAEFFGRKIEDSVRFAFTK